MSGVCSQVRHMCPPPVAGRGPGESRCEQNGLCQYVPLSAPAAPKVSNGVPAVTYDPVPLWLSGLFMGLALGIAIMLGLVHVYG